MLLKIFAFLFFLIASFKLLALDNRVIVASTTSTYDTGLLSYLNNFLMSLSVSHDSKKTQMSLGKLQILPKSSKINKCCFL